MLVVRVAMKDRDLWPEVDIAVCIQLLVQRLKRHVSRDREKMSMLKGKDQQQQNFYFRNKNNLLLFNFLIIFLCLWIFMLFEKA
jgi:hypothetical protein